MKRQVDEVDTLEIEIEDMEAQKHLAQAEGQIGRDELKRDLQQELTEASIAGAALVVCSCVWGRNCR